MTVVLFCLLANIVVASAALNCTRYQDPCEIERGPMCCGYPFFDCLSDGLDTTCQSIRDFPELEAEFMFRLREAMDGGEPNATLSEIRHDVNGLLGSQDDRPAVATTTQRNIGPRRSGPMIPRRRPIPTPAVRRGNQTLRAVNRRLSSTTQRS